MADLRWLRLDAVLAMHARQIAEHGGDDGVRDRGLLESALARPRNAHAYADPEPDVASLAAAYLVGVVGNHPFVDGNKRTGYVATRTFLRINGFDLDASAAQKYALVMGVADGSYSEEEVAEWIRRHQVPLEKTP